VEWWGLVKVLEESRVSSSFLKDFHPVVDSCGSARAAVVVGMARGAALTSSVVDSEREMVATRNMAG